MTKSATKNPSENSRLYRTHDIYHSTVLVLTGHSLANIERHGTRAFFVFRDADTIPGTISKFYSGELRLDPQKVFEIWRGLRSMAWNVTDAVRELPAKSQDGGSSDAQAGEP